MHRLTGAGDAHNESNTTLAAAYVHPSDVILPPPSAMQTLRYRINREGTQKDLPNKC